MPPRGVSTRKSRAASRKNGVAGAKHGKKGGRPRGALDPELLDQLGPPPVDKPLKLARWWTKYLALIAWEQAKGKKGIDKLASEVRQAAKAAGSVIPHDIVFAAAAKLKQDDEDQAADAGGKIVERKPDEPRRSRAVRSDPI